MVDQREFISLGLLREGIEDDILGFVNNEPDVLVLQYPPGSGKTTGTVNVLLENGITFAFFGAKHKSLEENISKPHNLLHLEGKSRQCRNPLKEDYEMYHLLDSGHTCYECPTKPGCEYKQILNRFYQEPETFVAVHQHFTILKDFIEKQGFDLVIFDENFLDAMSMGGQLVIEDLYYTEKLVKLMPRTPEREWVLQMLRKLTLFIYSNENPSFPIPKGLELMVFVERYQIFLIERLKAKQWIYKDIVTWLIDFIVMDNKKKIERKSKNLGRKKMFYLEFVQYDFSKLDIGLPIIILDATTPVDVYGAIMEDRDIKSIEPKVMAESHAYQLTTHSYPMSFLKKEPVRNRLFEITKKICEKFPEEEIFICVRKRFRPYLEKYLKDIPNANIAHYGGLRGANSFLKANVAVLIGTPFPNPDVVDTKAQIMGVKKKDIFEMDCNQEVLQTIHRIRPLLKSETWVYLLTNIETGYICNDFKKLPITQLESEINT